MLGHRPGDLLDDRLRSFRASGNLLVAESLDPLDVVGPDAIGDQRARRRIDEVDDRFKEKSIRSASVRALERVPP